MEEDSPTSDPILFPFQLSPEQARDLNALSADQWLQHCQNVRANHPRTEVEIDRFLSLPIEEIVSMFRDAVKHLVASSTPPSGPPIPSPTPSTSTSDPANPIILPTTDIPICPIQFSREELTQIGGYTDRQFFILAKTLQDKPNRKKGPLKTFLSAHPTDVLAASIKQLVLSQLPPPKQ
jgi:hypothetical protein